MNLCTKNQEGESDKSNQVIEGLGHRLLIRGRNHRYTFSSISCPVLPGSWHTCSHLCSIGSLLPSTADCLHFQRIDRIKWSSVPFTDVTIIYNHLGSLPFDATHWFPRMLAGRPHSLILVFIDPGEAVFTEDYRRKVKQIGTFGYWTYTWNVCECELGASCRRSYTITFCGLGVKLHVPDLAFFRRYGAQKARSSDNHLAHYRVSRKAYRSSALVQRSSTPGSFWRGHLDGDPVYGPGTCLPCTPNLWIETQYGCRRVLPGEWMTMKGYSSTEPILDLTILYSGPGQHLWSTLGDILLDLLALSEAPSLVHPVHADVPLVQSSPFLPDPPELTWRPPSFNKRGRWYRKRVANLRRACSTLSNNDEVFADGLRILDLHRHNYSDDGPKHLVLLWWEWPAEHHAELRHGLSMNFLSQPPVGIKPNVPMNDAERATAVKFVDELCSLGVLEPEPFPGNVVNTCPLFLVPKPGQPGQYRCIADMKKGGQNSCVGADPVQMTSSADILPRLYRGGYSATLDIAKYFHIFPTVEDERPYLGCIHPVTGEMKRYATLPMGAGNSPGASARFGAVFLRLVTTTLPAFQGHPMRNDIASGFAGLGFDPGLGIGRILLGPDGLPACILWIHVDDLLVHGPTLAKCIAGLSQLLDLTVQLGFICQRAKTVPPCQRVKYCGFIYDTTNIPTMCIPDDKISHAQSQVAFVQRPDIQLSRIGLAITVGHLQSLVPATPGNIGATFLRQLYDNLHSTSGQTYSSHLDFFYEALVLSPLAMLDLVWWSKALAAGLAARCVPQHTAHLGVAWGDGSGSGTGGTFEWVAPDRGPLPVMRTWMGSWSPSVHRCSSNWRELRTLVAALHPSEHGLDDLQDVQLFYFTDNSTVYHIARSGSSSSPQLHKLVQELKLLELSRGCRLDVIHVPGTTMIAQGTDGQSRGVWVSPLQLCERNITAELFRPAPPSDALLTWVLGQLPSPRPPSAYLWVSDSSCWLATSLLHRHCVWTLYPTTARQGILAAVFAWIESPMDSSHVFLVPRLFQRDFGRVNKHILFLGQFDVLPLPENFSPLVPFVLFYLPPFVRSTKRLDDAPWLDQGAQRSCPDWVRSQMEFLRGLSGASLPS